MKDEIRELFYSKEPLCPEGRIYLIDRGLDPEHAIKKGICSKDGNIYFMYLVNGEVVRWKARSMTDKKKQFMSKLSSEDEKTFKMPFFSQSKDPSSDYLVITEGEFDCVALGALGCLNVVSLPNGSGSVETSFRNNFEFLQQFNMIYIAFDMDKPGEEAAKKAMSMIAPSKYRRICFPFKDANEWIKESLHDVTFKDLETLMLNAKKLDNPQIVTMSDIKDNYFKSVSLGPSSGWNKLDYLLGGVRTGEVTVVTADTGSGKSTFCINLFKNLAESGFGIWLNSYEMNPMMVTRKFAGLIIKKKMKFEEFSQEDIKLYSNWMKKKNCHINESNSKVDIASLRNLFEMASLAYGVKYILLDHLDYIHAHGKKQTTLENIDESVREIHTLAMEFNVGVILVVHPKQLPEKQEVSMSDLKGSAAIKQYADNIIILTRMNRISNEGKINPDDTRVKVRVCKNRLMGKEGSFFLWYDPNTDGYTEDLYDKI